MSRFQEKTVSELRQIKEELESTKAEALLENEEEAIDACIEEVEAVIQEKSAAAVHEIRHRVFQALRGAFLQTQTEVAGTDEDEFAQTAFEVLMNLTREDVDAACEGSLTE